MFKRKYIKPEIEEMEAELANTILEESYTQPKGGGGEGGEVDDPNDAAAKGWGAGFFDEDER